MSEPISQFDPDTESLLITIVVDQAFAITIEVLSITFDFLGQRKAVTKLYSAAIFRKVEVIPHHDGELMLLHQLHIVEFPVPQIIVDIRIVVVFGVCRVSLFTFRNTPPDLWTDHTTPYDKCRFCDNPVPAS